MATVVHLHCSHLTTEQKIDVQLALSTSKIAAMGMAKLYKSINDKWSFEDVGVAAITTDVQKKAHYLRLVDPKSDFSIIFEQELYVGFRYNLPKVFFHVFEGEDAVYGLSFSSHIDAKIFYQQVLQCLSNTQAQIRPDSRFSNYVKTLSRTKRKKSSSLPLADIENFRNLFIKGRSDSTGIPSLPPRDDVSKKKVPMIRLGVAPIEDPSTVPKDLPPPDQEIFLPEDLPPPPDSATSTATLSDLPSPVFDDLPPPPDSAASTARSFKTDSISSDFEFDDLPPPDIPEPTTAPPDFSQVGADIDFSDIDVSEYDTTGDNPAEESTPSTSATASAELDFDELPPPPDF